MTPFIVMLIFALSWGAQWSAHSSDDGLRVETREVEGSAHEEVRVTTRARAPSQTVCEALWPPADAKLEAGFKMRRVLRETEDERLTYEQIEAPLVSDRDYTLLAKRTRTADGGCELEFRTRNDLGPPPRRGFVRVPVVRGHWTVRPAPLGGALVVYTIYSEPGGGIPAFLSRGPSRSQAVEWLRRLLARADVHDAR